MTRIARLLLMAGALHSFSGASAEETPAAAKVAPTDGGDASVYGPIRYDPSGNIYGIGSESGVSSSYSYDPMSRLVTANVQRGGNIQTNTYGYDRYGNRTSVTGASGVTTTYAVNESTNRLEAGADAYAQYDSGGNLTSWIPPGSVGQRHYAYDSLNMIKREQVWTGSMTLSVHHIYTADDERYWTFRENGGANTSTYTIRDLGGKVLREFSEASDGTFSARDYLYRDGLLLAAVTPSAEHHYSLDHLGTPRVVTDANRYKIGEHTYFPFGAEITDDSPTDGPLRFTGHERDADLLGQTAGALDYMHARYYSSNVGRFVSVDPVLDMNTAPHNPQAWNRYAYSSNHPLLYIDPDGRLAVPWHFGISYVAARRSGMSFGRSLSLGARTAWVDVRKGSQSRDAGSANMHAMRGRVGDRDQTIAEGRAGTLTSIKSSLSRGDVAAALHTVQDAATPLHQDRVWSGYRGLGLRDAIAHILADLFPSWSTVTTATANSEQVLTGAPVETLPLFSSDPLPPPGPYNDPTSLIFGFRLPGDGAIIDGVWYFATSVP